MFSSMNNMCIIKYIYNERTKFFVSVQFVIYKIGTYLHGDSWG